MKVLVPADGYGRNGLWLARQGLTVTTVDVSPVGVERARKTAADSWDFCNDPASGSEFVELAGVRICFTHARPIHAGDVLVSQSTIESIRPVGSMTTLTTVTQIRTADGEHVCTARSTLVERGA